MTPPDSTQTARSSDAVVIGVDGGGTRTRLVLLDPDGRVRARGTTSATGIDRTRPAHEAVRRISAAIRDLLWSQGFERPEDAKVRAVWCGLAGAAELPVRHTVEQALAREGLAERVGVGSDAEAAFEAAFGSQPGWLLVAGTGSVAWARDGTGAITRVGGWGREFGDEGSAFDLGLQAVRAVLQGADGRQREPGFAAAICDQAARTDPAALAAWASTQAKHTIAALAPLVTRAAEQGDPCAIDLVDAAVTALERHVTALEQRAPRAPLALAGGLIEPKGPLRERLEARLVARGVELRPEPVDAALGAAHLARRCLLHLA